MRVELTHRRPRIVYFRINGESCPDLYQQLHGRRGLGGGYLPLTTIRPEMDGDWMTAVDITNAPEIHLPRWNGERRGSREVRAVWRRFLEIVERHERVHHDHYGTALRMLRDQLEPHDRIKRREFDRLSRSALRAFEDTSRQFHAGKGKTRAAWEMLRTGP